MDDGLEGVGFGRGIGFLLFDVKGFFVVFDGKFVVTGMIGLGREVVGLCVVCLFFTLHLTA